MCISNLTLREEKLYYFVRGEEQYRLDLLDNLKKLYPLLPISDEYEASFEPYDWLVLFWALSWLFGHNSQFGQWLKMRSDVTIFLLNHRPEFLEARLALTRVNYHRKVYVSKLLD